MSLSVLLRRVLASALPVMTLLVTDPYGAAAASSGELRQAQEALQQKGFDPGQPDGVAGTRTRNAVQAFQSAHGLSATGGLDGETLRLLGIGPLGGPLPVPEAGGS